MNPAINVADALRDANEMNQNLAVELGELKAEAVRHHRDFERISDIVERSINNYPYMSRVALLGTLREVRGIVG